MPPPDEKPSEIPIKDILQRNLDRSANDKKYDEQRDKLLQEEQTEAWDSRVKHNASETQNEAADIVRKIREHERDNLFGNKASEAIPGPETLDMGGQFLTNRDRIIEKSQLYSITQKMPKGAHLHLHFNSELPPRQLLTEAEKLDNMFIRSTRPLLTNEDFEVSEMVFNVLPVDTQEADIFSATYNPEWKAEGSLPWMKWKHFCQSFRNYTSGEPDEWIIKKMVLQEDEVYGMSQTVNGVWARFNQATRCFKGLMNYESVYRWYIRNAIKNMRAEKVMYAELRPMLMDKFIPTDDGAGKIDLNGQMEMILDEVSKITEELKREDRLNEFPFGVKIIYCTPRSIPKAKMRSELEDCIRLKLKYPDLICGFDLVGAEDRPNSINFYHAELLAFVRTCTDLNLTIPFMFHAGETLLDTGGSKDPAQSNLYESVLLNAKRIGHGFSLTKHPKLIDEFKKRDICIELCPISNELLHLCRNVKEHPYPELLTAGIPCTVNADNPSLFRSSMSHEFYQVMVGTPTMSLHGWKQLAEWSLVYSCLSRAEKEKGLEILRGEWEGFCGWIVEEFGPYVEGLGL
ncbi:Metallo-dependent hydrolase [Saccharata proteae CBS 121410]|uniref:adenosine deaminase n=1 Tax=Saccharata proteae CBS 121410 TaxID=1314787 RepID=A0A9P4HXU5_9PEZI|nr:Metallo-dependent hydrolase [Saccharata proteae CBS 121410]